MSKDIFKAIADPNRRNMLSLLTNQRLTITGLAEFFRLSRSAVAQHIKVLAECGLVVTQKQGRERYCEARPGRLSEIADWVAQYGTLRDDRAEGHILFAPIGQLSLAAQPAAWNGLADLQVRRSAKNQG